MANANQAATVGTAFSYTINAFTDAESPQNLTYSASLSPANGLSFDPVTRAITDTPVSAVVSSVTITATDAGGLSASTSFSITTSCPALTASISGALTVCAGQSTVLTASGGVTYQFGGATIPTPTTDSSMVMVSSPGVYSVTVTGANGCSSVATTTVSADPSPILIRAQPANVRATAG